MSTEERFLARTVAAWHDGDAVVIAGQGPDGWWRWWQVDRETAVQLADQLYLLTKESP